MKWPLILGLLWLICIAKTSTDAAIFISAMCIILALPEKKETP